MKFDQKNAEKDSFFLHKPSTQPIVDHIRHVDHTSNLVELNPPQGAVGFEKNPTTKPLVDCSKGCVWKTKTRKVVSHAMKFVVGKLEHERIKTV